MTSWLALVAHHFPMSFSVIAGLLFVALGLGLFYAIHRAGALV